MAEKWAISQEDSDQPHHQDRNCGKVKFGSSSTRGGNQGGNQSPTSHKEGNKQKKYEEQGKKKYSGNCFVCGKQGHRAQDCYQEVKLGDTTRKSSANMAYSEPRQEN